MTGFWLHKSATIATTFASSQKLEARSKPMENPIIETQYPLSFRKEDAAKLGHHVKDRHSMMLIGMRRVGIGNFLRFFLNHKDIIKTYVKNDKDHLFITIDLNDLVESELFPFWILTLKRIADSVEQSKFDIKVQKQIELLFLDSIQSQDLFLTIDSVRRALIYLISNNIMPTLFFIRFDRIKDAATPVFFDNLEGLKEATHHKLAYVFTSYRDLHGLSPHAFTKNVLPIFSHNIYIKPTKQEDIETIFKSYNDRYKLTLATNQKAWLFEIVGGNVQYLQLALIVLHEDKVAMESKEKTLASLVADERVSLQSEELWESLTSEEQEVLRKIVGEGKLSPQEEKQGKYLWETGFVSEKDNKLFSPLFTHYVVQQEKLTSKNQVFEFTKKEHTLFSFLKENINEICERESIITAVWPEVEAVGVSDWAIDRLVARVRSKLKEQGSHYEIQTIKTRGYKLIHTD